MTLTNPPIGSEHIIRTKLRPPAGRGELVARPRLQQRLRELVAANPVLGIYATAGSGKTTAVAQAFHDDERLAWLTVDESDVAPGRLLTYLEAALSARAPAADAVASSALSGGLSHVEAAGLLAESAEGRPIVLVLDEVERLVDFPAPMAALNALLRYAPASLRIVLISRRDVPLVLRSVSLAGAVTVVGEGELAFTTTEADDALTRVASAPVSAAEAVAATGGWVTGVLFEAWRSEHHVAGAGGELDPLHGYLATQILEGLEEPEQDFLIRTSLLRRVDPDSAARLGIADARALLERLRRHHLPVTWEPEGPALQCHARFREYLLELLGRRDGATVVALRHRHADLLRGWGQLEEAVEEYLAAGAVGEAVAVADRAIEHVVDRLDLDVASRWLDRVPPETLGGHPGLLSAELMVAIGREQFERGSRAADQLRARHTERLSPRTLGLMAWCYWVVGRSDASRAVEAQMPPGLERRVVRFQLTLNDNEPIPERDEPPDFSGTPLDALLLRIHYVSGRLREVRDAPLTRWSAAVVGPWRIEAERAMGRLDLAYERYRAALTAGTSSARLHGIIGPEVLGDLGRVDDALSALHEGRPRLLAAGSPIWELQSSVLEARLHLRFDVDRRHALALLRSLAARRDVSEYAFIAEEIATWIGLALLHDEADEAARASLRQAVDSMVAGVRILELPTAAVYLAEASWRLGDEDAADAAADLALDAAGRQGSNHLLLQALADFPAVLVRRLDAEATADSRWHALGRILATQPGEAGLPPTHAVRLHDLGSPRVVVDGEVVRPQITKSLEVLAYLARERDHRVDRRALLSAIFDSRADHSSRTYLRQAVHKLRELMPDDAEVVIEPDQIALVGATVTTESARFERMLDEAARLGTEERLVALEAALELYETGEYLAGRDSNWIAERRGELAVRAADARFDAAELHFAANELGAARAHLDAVLATDPYRERAWRLAMRIAAAYGDEDRVLAVFRACERALGEIGIAPSPSTRQLVDALRR